MPRPPALEPAEIAARALLPFWRRGFEATSVEDLVAATGLHRHGLYSTFGDKRGLFLACLEAYDRAVVDPAFEPVEAAGAGWREVRAYFETQIARAEAGGLPGPGCLFANSTAELAAHDDRVRAAVQRHRQRLASGFEGVLKRSSPPGRLRAGERRELSRLLVTGAQGLWTLSRAVSDAAELRRQARTLVRLVQDRVDGASRPRSRS